ncbi:MAG: long-chain fatty acid--CoA ligase [Cyanobacteria bacterium NC_groundwater_1444_Ag_S-0.65um_54_12]|nr:long-chain fatty acid--CoA ligase [Cyanobacteria bacterium NC_groundwater_1444_Ag_S-0.65um_54_12]
MSKTIPAIFRDTVSAFPEKTAMLVKKMGHYHSITYREFDERVEQLAAALLELGIGAGERIAILAENCPQWLIVDQAALSLGAIVVPIYSTLTAEQIRYLLNDAGAKVIFCSDAMQSQKVIVIRHELPALQHIFVFAADCQGHDIPHFDALLLAGFTAQERTRRARAERYEQITPKCLASLVYTSGTTGEPKAAMLSHGNFSSNVLATGQVIEIADTDTFLSFLPLSHVLERIAYYLAVWRGATIAFAESMETVAANLQEVQPTFLVTVPRMLEKIHQRTLANLANEPPLRRELFWLALEVGEYYHQTRQEFGRVPFPTNLLYELATKLVFRPFRARLGGRLRCIFSGGASLAPSVGQFFMSCGIPVIEGYGLTETAPILTLNPPEAPHFGTVGKAIPGVTIRLKADGEIVCQGPNVMPGYWNQPEATREAIDSDGWFHTGDIGAWDEAGYLRIIDRKKELIVLSNGKKVAPLPLERQLLRQDLIDQAMIVGEGKHYLTALIVPDFPALEAWAGQQELTVGDRPALLTHPSVVAHYDRIICELNRTLAPFEQIKMFALLPDSWTPETGEMTPTLKLKRRVIAEKYRETISALYANAPATIAERMTVPV